MSLKVPFDQRQILGSNDIKVNIVFEVDTLSTKFSVLPVKGQTDPTFICIEYDDDELFYGGGNFYDECSPGFESGVLGVLNIIELDGTTTRITQQLEQDRGAVSSVSTMKVRLADINGVATKFFTRGIKAADPMGDSCSIYIALNSDTLDFPDDYTRIFRGIISDINLSSGFVDVILTNAEDKKRQTIFKIVETELFADLLIGETGELTHIDLQFEAEFIAPGGGIRSFVIIEDEIIEYQTIDSGTNRLVTLNRGQFQAEGGTAAAAHSAGTSVTAFYSIEGELIPTMLRIMISGSDDPFQTAIDVESYAQDSTDSIEFLGDITELFGLSSGDSITTTGSTNPSNDSTYTITSIIVDEEAKTSTVLTGDTSIIAELASPAVSDFFSQYNTMNEGLEIDPSLIDIERFQFIENTFLPSKNIQFFAKEEIDGRDLIEKELMLPYGCFTVPSRAKTSIGIFSPPIPSLDLLVIDKTNIMNASQISQRRSVGKNFHNQIIYKFDELAIESENKQFVSGIIRRDQTAIDNIEKTSNLTIEARALRQALGADIDIRAASARRLDRFANAAIEIPGVRVLFNVGLSIDPGDILDVNFADLTVGDQFGERNRQRVFFEVKNRTIDLRKGEVVLDLLDTQFETDTRAGLISQSSFFSAQISPTEVTVKASFGQPFGSQEFLKWEVGMQIVIRDEICTDFHATTIVAINGNNIAVADVIPFAVVADVHLMELDEYDVARAQEKALFAFMSDNTNDFGDGGAPYTMI